ncbi:MAG: HipA domain-containing protein [Bacteroidota bacterium]|nr:HipA domain-containing protein [Bacteroidota bacterium]MDP4275337.1 HipA domain-containing protein [Bacteroidota bacterium]
MRCLYCYQPLSEQEVDFHASCCKKIFGTNIPPELPYDESQMNDLAWKIIQSQTTVTGVQPKLSLNLTGKGHKTDPKRFTIVGLWGNYILKPPTANYPEMPEVEDLTMHLARIAKINIVPHSLIRLKSGQLAYITKRVDRTGTQKLHMEDMCQLTERLTEHKYQASYEQIGKAILKYSANPGLDIVNFCEIVLFSFLTGNADMHLKNFSLIYDSSNMPVLAPAYDMLSTVLVNPADDEDAALTLNGKKKRIKRYDFEHAFTTLKLEAKQQANIFSKMEKVKGKWQAFIQISFLSEDFKSRYLQLIHDRFDRIS